MIMKSKDSVPPTEFLFSEIVSWTRHKNADDFDVKVCLRNRDFHTLDGRSFNLALNIPQGPMIPAALGTRILEYFEDEKCYCASLNVIGWGYSAEGYMKPMTSTGHWMITNLDNCLILHPDGSIEDSDNYYRDADDFTSRTRKKIDLE